MKNRAIRAAALTASLLLMVAVPAQASPVQIGDVIQVVSSSSQRSGGQGANVELRFLSQDDRATAGTTIASAADNDSTSGSTASSSGVVVAMQDPAEGGLVQTEVTEDIGVEECECGDFEVPVAGFPKWPFIPLVGLVCLVPDLCTKGKCTPGPNEDANCQPIVCTVNCNPVPEPASLLLFGSGIAALGAGIRRRRAQKNVTDQATTISGS